MTLIIIRTLHYRRSGICKSYCITLPRRINIILRSLLYACFSDLSTINFHREFDALFFQFNIQYLYLNDIADTDHFQRMFDKTVTHL